MRNTQLLPSILVLIATTSLGLGLVGTSAGDDPVAEAVHHKDRLESDLVRDFDRQPTRILDFFDVKRGQVVADLMAGDGYYTEILSRVVGKDGAVSCQNTKIPLRVFAEEPLTARLADDHLSNVVRLDTEFEDSGLTLELREVCLHLLC